MKRKICHVFSEVEQGAMFVALIDSMDRSKYEQCFVMVANRPIAFLEQLRGKGCEAHFVELRGRRHILGAAMAIRRLFRQMRPDIVHTHLVNGSLVGLIGAALAGIKKRVSYRHHSNEAHVYFPHAVFYDHVINRLSRYVLANTKMTADILTGSERVPAEKVRVFNYGFDLDRFSVSEAAVDAIKVKYGLHDHFPIIGVVSRFVPWKGVQHIIPAAAKILAEHPNGKLVLANAKGSFKREIMRLLGEHLDPAQYVLIPFEPGIYALYRCFDVFVHVPIDRYCEAFGQTYVEALGLGVPSVFTISGIAGDFIVNEENAMVVPYCDPDAIYRAIKKLLEDENLKSRLTERGRADVHRLFGIKRLADKLDRLYSSF